MEEDSGQQSSTTAVGQKIHYVRIFLIVLMVALLVVAVWYLLALFRYVQLFPPFTRSLTEEYLPSFRQQQGAESPQEKKVDQQ